MDNGNTGMADTLKYIISKLKTSNVWPTSNENLENSNIFSDRVIIENYFG